MAISKIILNGVTQMDVTQDTVASTNLLSGYTATKNDGTKVNGAYVPPSAPTLQSKTVTPTKSSQNVTPDATYDGLSSVTVNAIPSSYIQPSGTKSITENGTTDVTNYASVNVNVQSGSTINNQNKTVTPSESQQSVTADSGYTGLGIVTVDAIPSDYVGSGVDRRTGVDAETRYWKYYNSNSMDYITHGITIPKGYYESDRPMSYDQLISGITDIPKQSAIAVTPSESQQTAVEGHRWLTGNVTVNAIPSDYVGSGVTRRSSTDLTASGATVTVPAGYYSAQASKTIASGTTGTPTASKGTVSNHSVSVTPSVTNTTGYISGGTKTGTAVTVSASELVSGTKTVTTTGTSDVTNYASVNVDIPFSTIYTGTTDPSSSLGVNGDIYLKVVG